LFLGALGLKLANGRIPAMVEVAEVDVDAGIPDIGRKGRNPGELLLAGFPGVVALLGFGLTPDIPEPGRNGLNG
jgi:hypothetical protein